MFRTYALLFEIMTGRERKRFWIMAAIVFFATLFEVTSIISILPFLQILTNPELIQENQYLAWTYEAIGAQSTRQFSIFAGITVLVFSIAGICVRAATLWVTTRFSYKRSMELSTRLLTTYLNQPYVWFLQRHSSELRRQVIGETDRVITKALLPAMNLLPTLFSALFLLTALLFAEPTIAISGIILIGSIYSVTFMMVKATLGDISRRETDCNQIQIQAIQEATSGYKELKLLGLEEGFIRTFRDATYKKVKLQIKGLLIGAMPRFALEALAYGGMIILILILLIRSAGSLDDVLPTLGLLAAVGLRLLPAAQNVYRQLAEMRTAITPLENIHADIAALSKAAAAFKRNNAVKGKIPLTQTLELRDISFAYSNATRPSLTELTLTIPAHSSVGIVGGTGAGKTTLVDVMMGLITPDSGEVCGT